MGIHYNEFHGPLDYILNPEDLTFVDGHVALPKKPGLGVEVNKELVWKRMKIRMRGRILYGDIRMVP